MRASLLASALGCVAVPAWAEGGAGEQPALEEIVVTADRADSFGAELVQVGTFRNARIIDVPLTVNVVPDQVLKAQAATSIYDALRNTAGVSRAQLNGATYDNIAIRGILVENRTSYRLNGSLPIVNLVDLPLENKERVEVLKGVGALYYGFAPPSGIINLTSKRATKPVVSVAVSATDHGGVSAHVDAGTRLGSDDQFGLRVNGVAGIIETGIERFDGERYLASIAADWDISDAVSLKLDAEHVRKNVTETPAITLLRPVNGRITLPEIPDPENNLGDEWLHYDAYATNLLGRLDVRFSDSWALTVEGGQAITERDRDFSQFGNYNLTTGEGILSITQTRDLRFRNRNARAELAGAFATGPLMHEVIFGLTSNWRYQNGRGSEPSTQTQNLFEPRRLRQRFASPRPVAPTRVEDRGAYVLDRIKFGDWLQLLAGVRYSDYESRTFNDRGVRTSRYVTDVWTPSVGVVVKPNEDLSVYATYLEGLEEGGTAPASADNANQILPPAVSTQYEAGIKGEAFTGVVFQVAAFQVERPSTPFVDLADNRFKVAGEGRYRGIEANFTGEVTPELSIYASGQYLDAELRKTVRPELAGKRPENTPEWTGSLFAEYRPAFVDSLAVGAGVFYVGDRAVNNENQAFVDGYTTLSLSARYTFEEVANGLTLQLNADNVTNERYWNSAGNNLLGVGMPRQIKLTARVTL